ncbi:MAG: pantetheine-phosphate adenylyltransferase, partial [Clostridia bacterium]|nr:pantetheine-phosphate adenylyltransferase [Clostridia bacterium]
YLFSAEQRVDMLRRSLAHLPNVEVVQDDGLLIDLARRLGAGVILRGIRGTDDLGFEMQMAVFNRKLSGIETVFLPASPEYGHLSSTIVNGYAMHGGDIRNMVPEVIVGDVERAHRK